MSKPVTDLCDARERRGGALSDRACRSAGAAAAAPMKRLSIDIPAELHTRIKVSCARRGLKIADEVRALLEREFRGCR